MISRFLTRLAIGAAAILIAAAGGIVAITFVIIATYELLETVMEPWLAALATAGIAILQYLQAHPETYSILEDRTAQLTADPPAGVIVNRVGSMFTFFFTSTPVTDWDSAKQADTGRFKEFFHFMLDRGVYLAPSQFEAGFVSTAHTEADIAQTVGITRQFGLVPV